MLAFPRIVEPVKPIRSPEYCYNSHANELNINWLVNFNFSLSFRGDLHLTAQFIWASLLVSLSCEQAQRLSPDPEPGADRDSDLSYAIHWHYLRRARMWQAATDSFHDRVWAKAPASASASASRRGGAYRFSETIKISKGSCWLFRLVGNKWAPL